MKPFYDHAGITLYHGDYRDVIPSLGLHADLIQADPPYGETSLEWDRWPAGWPTLLSRYCKPNGSMWCFGSLRMFLQQRDEFTDWRHAQEIVWEKHNGSAFHADRFKRVHELAVHFYRGEWRSVFKNPVTTNDATKRTLRRKKRPPHTGHIEASAYASKDGGPRLMRSVIQIRSCHGYADNETQKPVGIITPLLRFACPPDGLVLVPFAGAGRELVAARELGLRAIGIEVRESQCVAAARRLAQGILFGAAG